MNRDEDDEDDNKIREKLAEAERLRDQWCAEYTRVRDVLKSVQDTINEALKDD